ncbi:P-loop NTPase fold protein [Christiangramia sp.]|uniref:P-loop NTPase fold protein n=1 Tax=Christiangramia sp. TaxID=1931228 RepID=UPI00261A4859|nr:P-loop NTPase fold protein [Christiangramia sp.]
MHFNNLSVKEESQRFLNHITLENNSRIILSGIFGIGKTYFINKFFESNTENFIEIKLNPVNYSVSQNEDIFELIKFDIGYQLFKEKPDFDQVKLNNLLATEFFLSQNFGELIVSLINTLSKIDHKINSIVQPILDLKQKVQKFKKEHEVDQEEELMSFLKEFKFSKGSFREENSITELINILIETVKENNPEKKIVLVIDDLDRIDPEHIFRILNVFSAHFDFYDLKDENKFGFDKVILICDIENIRGIFHNRYGTDIDFSGYIDKFYSLEIFKYDFRNIIISNLKNFYKSIKSENRTLQGYIINNQGSYYTKELSFLLQYFIQSNTLSMRSLVDFLNIEYEPEDNIIKTGGSFKVHTIESPIFLIFDFLIKLFGGLDNLRFAVEKTMEKFPEIELSTYNDYWDLRLGNLAMILDFNSSNLKPKNDIYSFKNENLNIIINYEINPTDYGVVGKARAVSFDIKESKSMNLFDIINSRINYFQILDASLKVYQTLPIEKAK